MTKDQLSEMFRKYNADELNWVGHCHDCGSTVSVLASLKSETEIEIAGGALYESENIIDNGECEAYLKCAECHGKDRVLRNFRTCEVYSRVVGYLRPIKQWNDGKQAEFKNRTMFKME